MRPWGATEKGTTPPRLQSPVGSCVLAEQLPVGKGSANMMYKLVYPVMAIVFLGIALVVALDSSSPYLFGAATASVVVGLAIGRFTLVPQQVQNWEALLRGGRGAISQRTLWLTIIAASSAGLIRQSIQILLPPFLAYLPISIPAFQPLSVE